MPELHPEVFTRNREVNNKNNSQGESDGEGSIGNRQPHGGDTYMDVHLFSLQDWTHGAVIGE